MANDVRNDYVIDAIITLLSSGECTHVFGYIDAVGKVIDLAQKLYLFDCEYPSEELIRRLSNQSHYLMRVRANLARRLINCLWEVMLLLRTVIFAYVLSISNC